MIKRNEIRQRIHSRIRAKLAGTGERPRLNVYRSLNHIYAQVIDDQKGVTIVSASTLATKSKTGGNVAAAKEIGKAIAEKAQEKGVKKVVRVGDSDTIAFVRYHEDTAIGTVLRAKATPDAVIFDNDL